MTFSFKTFARGARDPELDKLAQRWYALGGRAEDSVLKVAHDMLDRLENLERGYNVVYDRIKEVEDKLVGNKTVQDKVPTKPKSAETVGGVGGTL